MGWNNGTLSDFKTCSVSAKTQVTGLVPSLAPFFFNEYLLCILRFNFLDLTKLRINPELEL